MSTRFRKYTLFGIMGVAVAQGGLVGCSASPTDEGDDSGFSNAEALSGGSCDRGQLVAAASGARRQILKRAFGWFDHHVPYSQSRSFEGYRTDCSGFVSMSWQLGTSLTTASLSAHDNGKTTKLSSYHDLLPGDALVFRVLGHGHVVLFAGWKDAGHTSACVIHEAAPSLGVQFHSWSVASLHAYGFAPIRSSSVLTSSSGDGNGDGCDPDALPVPPIPPGSQSCDADGDACSQDSDCCSQKCTCNRCDATPVPPIPPASAGAPGGECVADYDFCTQGGVACCSGRCDSFGACAPSRTTR